MHRAYVISAPLKLWYKVLNKTITYTSQSSSSPSQDDLALPFVFASLFCFFLSCCTLACLTALDASRLASLYDSSSILRLSSCLRSCGNGTQTREMLANYTLMLFTFHRVFLKWGETIEGGKLKIQKKKSNWN